MKIQEVSQKTQISKRNIHFYIQEGLITPDIDSGNGYYDFKEKEVQQLKLIQLFRNAQLPLSTIRFILKEPSTTSFYLSQYLHTLNQQKKYLEKNIESMNYILHHLPLQIHFDNLYQVVQQANIPNQKEEIENQKDYSLITRFLWSRFIPEGIQNDFHEFLWAKINRLAQEDSTGDFNTLSNYLNTLDASEIETLFTDNYKHYEFAVGLDEQGCLEYALKLEEKIKRNLKENQLIYIWKQDYYSFYLPNIRLYDSKNLQDIIVQISPFFKQYVKNIHFVCSKVYENKKLMKEMEETLSPYLDLHQYHHAAIEAFGSLDTVQNGN